MIAIKRQIEALMELARSNMEDAEHSKNSYGMLMYYKGKIVGFEYSYALMKGLELTELWKDEATNDEFKIMKQRCEQLVSNCDGNI